MSKKPTEINPIPAENLKKLIEREKIKQQELADLLFMSQQSISRIIQKKQSLTDQTARAIIKAFPDYRIEWLLGYDDVMTHTDKLRTTINNRVDSAEALNQVIRLVTDDVCARAKIKRPFIPPIPDFFTLQNMLRDYAELIVSDYLFNRKNSAIWRRIDNTTLKKGEEK